MREHTDGSFPFANDFNAVVRDALASGTLVRSGCTVDDGGSNDLTLNVDSGDVFVNGSSVSVSGQSVTLDGADADHDRYDIVVVDGSGSAATVTGTATGTPKAPSIPSNAVLLAIVEVPADASGVTGTEINDARAVVALPNSVITQGHNSGLDADTLDGADTPLPPAAIQDGTESGLDADKLDGNDTPLPASAIEDGTGSELDADLLDGNDTPLPASAIDDGSGSGLDADTVDGKHAADIVVPKYKTYNLTVQSDSSVKKSLPGKGIFYDASYSGGVDDYASPAIELFYNDGSSSYHNNGDESSGDWDISTLHPNDGAYITDVEFIADNYNIEFWAEFIVF